MREERREVKTGERAEETGRDRLARATKSKRGKTQTKRMPRPQLTITNNERLRSEQARGKSRD